MNWGRSIKLPFGLRKAAPAPAGTLGIHIGSRSICVAHVLQGAGPRPRARLMLVESRSAPALRAALKRSRLGHLPCRAVLSHDEYQLVLTEAADVPPAELAAAMRWRIKDLIAFPVDEAVIDVIAAPDSAPGVTQRSVMVVVARQQTVQEHISLLQQAGLNVLSLDVADLAVRNVVALSSFDAGGVGLLLVLSSYSTFTLYRQGALYLSRRIPIGFDDVKRAMDGDATAQDELFVQMTPDLRRSLDYYESHHRLQAVTSLVAWPPTKSVGKLAAGLTEILGIPSHAPPVNELMDIEADPKIPVSLALLAVGAALRQDGLT